MRQVHADESCNAWLLGFLTASASSYVEKKSRNAADVDSHFFRVLLPDGKDRSCPHVIT